MEKSIGLIIVGDEILSGRRQDKHLSHIISLLDKRDLALDWCRIIGDDIEQQVSMYKDTFAGEHIVFSTGGIGATPDDLTREAASQASGFELDYHPEGLSIVEARFGDEINDDRRRLVQFPRNSRLIPNPINNIPGFSVYDHHFVPGFPQMAWPMIEWVLDTLYPSLQANKKTELAVTVNALEGQIMQLMKTVNHKFENVSAFSLPKIVQQEDKKELVLGVKGVGSQLQEAMSYIQSSLDENHFEWENIDN